MINDDLCVILKCERVSLNVAKHSENVLAGYRGAGRWGAVTLWNTGTKYDDQARRWAQRIG